ncbi:MAG: hypothetical protein RBU21_11220 [FCB group bacterium]|jgi:hypothetical protein|nr:hypothetical protein [FCB group bacterium]
MCHSEIKAPVAFHGFVAIPAEAFSNLAAEWLNTLDPAMYPPLDSKEEG